MTLSPDTDIYEAMALLLSRRLTDVPVVDSSSTLRGMLTERDCLKVVVGAAMDGLPGGRVDDYMTTPAVSVSPTASIYDVVHIFLRRSFRKLPVVNDKGRVVGQVSRRDALVAIESQRDNPRLYGTPEAHPLEAPGVDAAMMIARGQAVERGTGILD